MIFVAIRAPLFLVYTILTCCCGKGNEFEEDYKFEDRIISYDYVKYELGLLNNFENHVVGINEMEFNRNIQIFRGQQQIEMQEVYGPDAGGAHINYIRYSLRKTIIANLSGGTKDIECSVCTFGFKHNDKAEALACHPSHIFH